MLQELREREASYWTDQYFPQPIHMQDNITTFDDQILWDREAFLGWATQQDCTLESPKPPNIGQGDFDVTLGPLIGKILFAARPSKWEGTREFWIPLGMIDRVLATAFPRVPMTPARRELVQWMLQCEQTRRWNPEDPNSRRSATGYRAFQILSVPIRQGTQGYFYRVNMNAEQYRTFASERYWQRLAQRDHQWFAQERGRRNP